MEGVANTATMNPAAAATRQKLIQTFASRLTSFQESRDAFSIFSQVTSGRNGSSSTSPPPPSSPPPPQAKPPKTLIVLDSSFNPPTLAHLRMATSALRSYSPSPSSPSSPQPLNGRDVRLLLLLAVNNADKAPKPAAFPIRMAMMHLFAHDLVSSLEQTGLTAGGGDRPQPKPEPEPESEITVDLALTTLPFFHQKSRAIADSGRYGSEDGAEQVFLAGYDTLIRIFNPKYYASMGGMREALGPFLARSRLRITTRTDDEWGGREEQVGYVAGLRDGGLEEAGGAAAWWQRLDLVDGDGEGEVVSSTRVREAAGAGDGEVLGTLVSGRVKEFVLGEGLYVGDE